VGDAATRLLLLLVLLMVIGNCGGGLPVGVCGDKGDIEDDVVAGDGQLLALVVMAAEELLLLTPFVIKTNKILRVFLIQLYLLETEFRNCTFSDK